MEILAELTELLLKIIGAGIVMIFHELPKAIVAHRVTHPIYRKNHKIRLNVMDYIDPLGVIMFIFSGVGWQLPAEYNPQKFSQKQKGIMAVALTGLLSNLLFMSILIPLYSWVQVPIVQDLVLILIYYNFAITIVNCLPVPPFDMAKVIYATSPGTYFKLIQNQRIIHVVFILLLVLNIIPMIVQSLFNGFMFFI